MIYWHGRKENSRHIKSANDRVMFLVEDGLRMVLALL